MVRLPALIDDLAKHDTRGRPTVQLIARNVREHGLIQTTKRGRGAAEMSVADAAALLIGVCVADTPSTAPEAVRIFTSLEPEFPNFAETGHAPEELPSPLREVTAASTFGEALSSLIAGADGIATLSDLSIQNVVAGYRARGGPAPQVSDLNKFEFSVGFRIMERIGYVAVSWAERGDAKLTLFGRTFSEQPSKLQRRPGTEHVDRRVEVNLGPNTFIRLGRLLKVRDVPEPPIAKRT